MSGRRLVSALLIAACVAGATAAPASSQALPPGSAELAALPAGSTNSPAPGFYAAPAELPAGNGDVIRSEPMDIALTLPTFPGQWPGDARRIMYRSISARGGAVPVTGAYVQSRLPWTGRGARPLAVVAPGTNGQGDQCAPSKTLATSIGFTTHPPSIMLGYEFYAVVGLLANGFDVVMTDYEGLGTPGMHTYMNRDAQAHAVLDAARAAFRLPGTDLRPESKVVITGYSQGGGATAAAAEQAATYAPELPIVGAVAGAPPTDLTAVTEHIDGTILTGAIGYALNSLIAAFPQIGPRIEGYMSPAGRTMLDTVGGQCLFDSFAQFGMRHTSDYTTTGESAYQILLRDPEIRAVVDTQRLGRVTPSFPVRVQGNIHDDAIPVAQVDGLAADWCAQGASVELVHDPMPPFLPGYVFNHQVPWFFAIQPGAQWMADRVNGIPAPSTCGAAPVRTGVF